MLPEIATRIGGAMSSATPVRRLRSLSAAQREASRMPTYGIKPAYLERSATQATSAVGTSLVQVRGDPSSCWSRRMCAGAWLMPSATRLRRRNIGSDERQARMIGNQACEKILIVEDDDSIRALFIDILTSEGYSVVGVSNGQEALDHLRSVPLLPALILLDLMTPELNGWDFRRIQLEDPQLRAIPVVALSAAERLTLWRVDADDHLAKPVQLDQLLAVVAQYCR